jgi:hypothetical protein
MGEPVELVFRREKIKESVRALIQRHARESIAAGSTEWEIFDGKEVSHTRYGVDEAVHAAFRKTFFLTTKHFITATPQGSVHIIEHRQVDARFFSLFKYPDPGPLTALRCECGGDEGQFAVAVIYDCDPEILRGLSAAKRNESYGWIEVQRRCSACTRASGFLNYECA